VDTDDEKCRIRQSQNGDDAAFEELMRTHQTLIHSLTFRMTGSLADAKDLAQETFVRAYRQLDSYQGTSKFSSWLYRIAVNACLDWQRREKRRAAVYHNLSEMGDPFAHNEPESAMDLDELSREVQTALMKLSDKQRAAIVLTVYGGHNHAEAAKILGCPETTVSWRIFTARRKLKKLLTAKTGGCHD
jgi:RNA polymerase sigma-70 factor (ECF subfamily)